MKKILFLLFISVAVLFSAEIFDDGKGLIWQDSDNILGGKKTWEEAEMYCSELRIDEKSDWRLPTIKELQSLVDVKNKRPAMIAGFKNAAAKPYWSDTVSIEDAEDAWLVHFYYGYTFHRKKAYSNYARCVRTK